MFVSVLTIKIIDGVVVRKPRNCRNFLRDKKYIDSLILPYFNKEVTGMTAELVSRSLNLRTIVEIHRTWIEFNQCGSSNLNFFICTYTYAHDMKLYDAIPEQIKKEH